jgi:hypothetical protein
VETNHHGNITHGEKEIWRELATAERRGKCDGGERVKQQERDREAA